MSDEASSSAIVGRIISQIGTVLAHTRDALLKDLLDDMPSYLPQVSAADSYSYDTFKKIADEESKAYARKFIESLFTRLGYDISLYEKEKEPVLTDLVRSVIVCTASLGECVKMLFDGQSIDWMSEAQKILNAQNDTDSKKTNPIKDLFGDDLAKIGGNSNIPLSMGGDNKISAILKLVMELISLIRKFHDLQWDKMKQDPDFARFVDENNFSRQLAGRILDHILIIMFRNGKEIFAEDIYAVVDSLEKDSNLKNRVKNEAEAREKAKSENAKTAFDKAAFETEFEENIVLITSLRKEIKKLEEKIEKEKQALQKEADDKKKEVVREV
ncbi:MAG: hypothetical protein LBJ21_05215, partial [Acidobacteriota bacterium]|nr:hypothetical protein [Acidobacteriota bacterium]